MGDPSVGGHQPDNPSEHWHNACKQFANEQQFCNNLSHPDFEPTTVLPTDPIVPKEKLSYEEQLDFALRQQCLIKPIVIHDDSYKTPFMTQEWLEISLNLPRSHREDRSLFKKAFKSEFPTLFSLPTDASAGLSLSSTRLRRDIRMKRLGLIREVASLFGVEYLHPNTNYIDFATELRKDTEFRKALYQLVSDFAERDRCNWICPLEIWEAHQSGEDLVNELRTIASLELYLKRGPL